MHYEYDERSRTVTDRAWTDAEIIASYIEQVEHDEREVMSGPLPTTDLLTLFDTCQTEADYHTAVGLYGYVPFEEVFEKRVTEWLAEHDAKVRAETLRDAASRADEWRAANGMHGGEWFPSKWAGQVAGWLEHRADQIEKGKEQGS